MGNKITIKESLWPLHIWYIEITYTEHTDQAMRASEIYVCFSLAKITRFVIIKHGWHIWEIHKVCKGMWAFFGGPWLCFSGANWVVYMWGHVTTKSLLWLPKWIELRHIGQVTNFWLPSHNFGKVAVIQRFQYFPKCKRVLYGMICHVIQYGRPIQNPL